MNLSDIAGLLSSAGPVGVMILLLYGISWMEKQRAIAHKDRDDAVTRAAEERRALGAQADKTLRERVEKAEKTAADSSEKLEQLQANYLNERVSLARATAELEIHRRDADRLREENEQLRSELSGLRERLDKST